MQSIHSRSQATIRRVREIENDQNRREAARNIPNDELVHLLNRHGPSELSKLTRVNSLYSEELCWRGLDHLVEGARSKEEMLLGDGGTLMIERDERLRAIFFDGDQVRNRMVKKDGDDEYVAALRVKYAKAILGHVPEKMIALGTFFRGCHQYIKRGGYARERRPSYYVAKRKVEKAGL